MLLVVRLINPKIVKEQNKFRLSSLDTRGVITIVTMTSFVHLTGILLLIGEYTILIFTSSLAIRKRHGHLGWQSCYSKFVSVGLLNYK
jgi:hypothetical protein